MLPFSSRIKPANQLFSTLYGSNPDTIARAPGRAEIIGNHTDYNSGYALSAAITQSTFVLAKKRSDKIVRVYSIGYSQKPSSFSLDTLEKGEHGHWLNYVKGVLAQLMKRGTLMEVDLLIDSDVPSSGGVSSSAALELSITTAVAALYHISIEGVEKAFMCQKAENGPYIGIPCGFLDQASSGLTQKDHVLFLDFKQKGSLPVSQIKQIPIDLSTSHLSFVVVVDKKVKRNLGTSGYPARRAKCEQSIPIISSIIGHPISSLRDISIETFKHCRKQLGKEDNVMRKRVEHIVYENQRVLDAVKALQDRDIKRFGALLTESGKSALELYELDEQTPELTTLVTKGRRLDGVVGMRNMGGGFTAVALALVENAKMDSFKKQLSKLYNGNLEFLSFEPGNGAELLR